MSKRKEYLILLLSIVVSHIGFAQNTSNTMPLPEIVTPGQQGAPPSDAIVLFDKGDLSAFESVKTGASAMWNVNGDHFTVKGKTGNIQTKERFGDIQLHIEWMTPVKDVKEGKEGQGNGNSGIYLMGKYEVQVLNSYINKTDGNRQAGSIYKFHAPLVNASVKPGEWQVYEILFTAPKYNKYGYIEKPGVITVLHNGVLVQYNAAIIEPTQAYSEKYPITDSELPIMLQDHGNEVSYRNIWVRRL